MRVLLVHNRYRTEGGEECHLDFLEKWLPQVGVEVRRFEVATPARMALPERVRLGLTLAYRPEGARLVREAIVREAPGIVHFHNIFPLLTPAAMREARRHGLPVVVTIHNYRFACPAGTLLRDGRIHEDCVEGSSLLCGLRNARGAWTESIAYGVALEVQRRLRLLHRWVNAYVAPSHFVYEMLVRAGYPHERICLIRHGTSIDERVAPPGEFAVFAGRLSHEKGVDTLVDASRLAPRVPLVIAGDGPLLSLVRNATNGTVSYLGQIAPEEVARLRRRSLFTVVPSRCYEALPLGALESMALGRAVLASSLGALSEIVEQGVTGALVPPGDPVALAKKMELLWRHKSRTAVMGAKAWRYAQDHFSPVEQAHRIAELYEQLVVSRSA